MGLPHFWRLTHLYFSASKQTKEKTLTLPESLPVKETFLPFTSVSPLSVPGKSSSPVTKSSSLITKEQVFERLKDKDFTTPIQSDEDFYRNFK